MPKSTDLPHEKETILQLAIEGLIKGYANSELTARLKQDFPELEEQTIETAVRQAIATIRERTLVDIDKIIPQHVELYEKIYQEFEKIRFVPGKLKAMRAKEKLIGLHKESNYIEVHNELNVDIDTEPEYDLNKLSSEEVNRLEVLMKKIVRQ